MITEADTCRKYVLPKLYAAGWNDDQISEQKTFTDGRIVVVGEKCFRKKQKRADYLLRFRKDFTIAVIEAKSAYKNAADGLQQSKEYANILGLKFAYSTNGKGIVEHDFITGKDADLEGFPTSDELWARLSQSEGITSEVSIYQAIAKDERRPGLYKQYAKDFFDLIIVDECHRGSARDESNWREILEYFEPAYQIGMTATPLRVDNRDTYRYFGNPVYTYSLKQGIEDGFLAPYRVHRVVPNVDATGWRPAKGELDKYGREIPDGIYGTNEFERVVSLKARTEAVAKHLTDFLMKTDRFAKTIVFCVDQEHAEDMRKALNNGNLDLVQQYPDYVCRAVSEEGSIGRGHLDRFMEIETRTPVILTTSQLLTTGIDAPMCKNIVLFKVINSMVDFKQIIGRGTRVRDDYGKLYFTIMDYTGSATRLFADPEFDGEPALIREEEIDQNGHIIEGTYEETQSEDATKEQELTIHEPSLSDDSEGKPRKYYVTGGSVEIVANIVYELDSDGKRLAVIKYTDYTARELRGMYTSAAELHPKWSDAEQRKQILSLLEDKGITFEQLAEATKQYDADPFDLLCHVAYNAPLRTRRERAERVRKDKKDFFEKFGEEARQILNEVLEKYIEFGTEQLTDMNILKVPPISRHGNLMEISELFGGTAVLRESLGELQNLLYSN